MEDTSRFHFSTGDREESPRRLQLTGSTSVSDASTNTSNFTSVSIDGPNDSTESSGSDSPKPQMQSLNITNILVESEKEKKANNLDHIRSNIRYVLKEMNWKKELERLPKTDKFLTFVVCFAVFVDMFVYSFLVPILPALSKESGFDSVYAGLIVSVYSATGLVGMLSLHVLGPEILWSRLSKKVVISINFAILSISLLLCVISPSFYILVAARAIQGLLSLSTWTTSFSLLNLTPAAVRSRSYAIVLFGQVLGEITAPLTGALCHQFGNKRLPYIIPFFLSLVTMILVFLLKDPTSGSFTSRNGSGTGSSSGGNAGGLSLFGRLPMNKTKWKLMFYIIFDRSIFAVSMITLIYATIRTILDVAIPFFLIDQIHSDIIHAASMITCLNVSLSISSFLCSYMISTGANVFSMLISGLLLSCLFTPLTILSLSPSWIALILVGFSVSCSMVLTPASELINSIATKRKNFDHDLIYLLYNVFWYMGHILGPLLGGISDENSQNSIHLYILLGLVGSSVFLIPFLIWSNYTRMPHDVSETNNSSHPHAASHTPHDDRSSLSSELHDTSLPNTQSSELHLEVEDDEHDSLHKEKTHPQSHLLLDDVDDHQTTGEKEEEREKKRSEPSEGVQPPMESLNLYSSSLRERKQVSPTSSSSSTPHLALSSFSTTSSSPSLSSSFTSTKEDYNNTTSSNMVFLIDSHEEKVSQGERETALDDEENNSTPATSSSTTAPSITNDEPLFSL